jgi:hypothetical protein
MLVWVGEGGCAGDMGSGEGGAADMGSGEGGAGDMGRGCKMFVVFYTVNLHICVFMACSTSCCIYDTLIDPSNVCVCVCTYVCMYVCGKVLETDLTWARCKFCLMYKYSYNVRNKLWPYRNVAPHSYIYESNIFFAFKICFSFFNTFISNPWICRNMNSNKRTKQTFIFLCYLHMSQITHVTDQNFTHKMSQKLCFHHTDIHTYIHTYIHTCCSRPFLAPHRLPKMNRCENSFCVVFNFGKALVIIRVSSSRVILFSLPRSLFLRGLPRFR